MRPPKPNSIEPPRYGTRMPGGVGGVASRGAPLSRSNVDSRPSIARDECALRVDCGPPDCAAAQTVRSGAGRSIVEAAPRRRPLRACGPNPGPCGAVDGWLGAGHETKPWAVESTIPTSTRKNKRLDIEAIYARKPAGAPGTGGRGCQSGSAIG